MRTPRRILIWPAVAGLALVAGYAMLKPGLDRNPRSNLGYLAWKAGFYPFSASFAGLIMRDTAFRESLKGERLDDIISRYRMTIHEGTAFPASSYRGRYQVLLREREPNVRCYWFDDRADDFGYCLWVENRRIKQLMIVKG